MATLTERIVMCEQGSADWFTARLGCVTSSRVADAIAKRKRVKAGEVGEEMACRKKLRYEIVGELLSGKAPDHYVSEWMEQGKEKEPLARTEYEIRNDCAVEQVGFVYHPRIAHAGASPDGVLEHGLIEIKCPKLDTHIDYLVGGKIPDDYLPQMLWQLACYDDAQYIDFVSYHPDLPEKYQVFQKRLLRSGDGVEGTIRGMESEVEQFLKEVDQTIERLRGEV